MKQYKFHFYLLFCLALIISPSVFAFSFVSKKATPPQVVSPPQTVDQRFTSEPFNAIDVNGPIGVQIIAGEPQPTVDLIGDAASLAQVYAATKNGVLYLGLRPTANGAIPGRVLAKVCVPQLNGLRYSGSGNVAGTKLNGPLAVTTTKASTGSVLLVGDNNIDLRSLNVSGDTNVHVLGIESSDLSINDDSKGNVNLVGKMVLRNVVYNGGGVLSVEWVDSADIKVTGQGRGQIFIAGVAGTLDVAVKDNIILNARYLHVDQGVINTSGNAHADVWTRRSLSALASGNSNIYYYKDPYFNGGYMNPQGSVLRMVGIK